VQRHHQIQGHQGEHRGVSEVGDRSGVTLLDREEQTIALIAARVDMDQIAVEPGSS